MKFLQQGAQNISRVIILLFLLLVVGVGIFLVVSKFAGTSPLQKLAAKDVRWVMTISKPEVLSKTLLEKDILPDASVNAALPSLLPGTTREKVADLLGRLPVETVAVGYPDTWIAAFSSSQEQCATFQADALQATLKDGLCVLHTTALDEELFDTRQGSVRSIYGAILPDNPAAVHMLLTPAFPLAEAVTAAWGGMMTPEALLAHAVAGKQFPVAMTLDQTAAGDLRLQGHILMGADHPVPESIQTTQIAQSALDAAPAKRPFVALPLDKNFYTDLSTWIQQAFGDDVARMATHVALEVTESITPVGLTPNTLPDASLLVTWDPAKPSETWEATLTEVDAADKAATEKSIQDSLTFLYGLTETPTTLPDKSKGVLVTASMENIKTETETMSGTTMTTYIAQEKPRLMTAARDGIFRISMPGTMSGAVLHAPEGTTSIQPWQMPIDASEQVVLRLPIGEAGRQLYAGLLLMRDRLRFDIVLTARS